MLSFNRLKLESFSRPHAALAPAPPTPSAARDPPCAQWSCAQRGDAAQGVWRPDQAPSSPSMMHNEWCLEPDPPTPQCILPSFPRSDDDDVSRSTEAATRMRSDVESNMGPTFFLFSLVSSLYLQLTYACLYKLLFLTTFV